MRHNTQIENHAIRLAKATDYEQIKLLLQSVNLPIEGVHENMNNFLILENNSQLIGTVGLELYGDKALLRSLAVAKSQQNRGYGNILCKNAIVYT